MMSYLNTKFHENRISSFRGVAMTRSFMSFFEVPRGITPTKIRGSKFPADMHNYIWCPIYIPSYMIIGSVVSEKLRWQDFGTDGRTDGRSDCTPRPAFAFGDAGKNPVSLMKKNSIINIKQLNILYIFISISSLYITYNWINFSYPRVMTPQCSKRNFVELTLTSFAC